MDSSLVKFNVSLHVQKLLFQMNSTSWLISLIFKIDYIQQKTSERYMYSVVRTLKYGPV